MEGILQN